MRSLLAAAVLVFALAGAWAQDSAPSREALATVVLYNQNDPASLALAKYYASRRLIPDAQLIGLNCSAKEEITRDEYLVDIEAPLRDTFTKRDWWKIALDAQGRRCVVASSMRFAAVIRGVPLKIRASNQPPPPANLQADIQPGNPMQTLLQHNEASVDSELSAMFTLLEEAPAVIGNSYYSRIAHILDLPPTYGPFLVCRLDGPSDAVVRKMIDDAIATEKSGLWGWAYLDERSILTAGYIEGDDWMARAGTMMRRQGIPVISDCAPETLPAGFPVTDAAIYYGWYDATISGPFAKPDFKFTPGAVAVHIHSYSAQTIRNTTTGWAGPLIAHGAAATMGNVYEPYLGLTVNFDLLQDRLMTGLTLAEAAYAATRGLSWMGVVLGDPLYRPYASWGDWSTDPNAAPNIWQRYRKLVLAAGGDPLQAAAALRELAADTGNSMPIEALGQAQAAAGLFDDALQTLTDAAKLEKKSNIRFRLALEQIEILRRAKRPGEALEKIAAALENFHTDEQKATLGQLSLILQPPPPPPKASPARK